MVLKCNLELKTQNSRRTKRSCGLNIWFSEYKLSEYENQSLSSTCSWFYFGLYEIIIKLGKIQTVWSCSLRNRGEVWAFYCK